MARPTQRDDGVVRDLGRTVRLAPDELTQIRNAAAARGTSISDFLRDAGLSASHNFLQSAGAAVPNEATTIRADALMT